MILAYRCARQTGPRLLTRVCDHTYRGRTEEGMFPVGERHGMPTKEHSWLLVPRRIPRRFLRGYRPLKGDLRRQER